MIIILIRWTSDNGWWHGKAVAHFEWKYIEYDLKCINIPIHQLNGIIHNEEV